MNHVINHALIDLTDRIIELHKSVVFSILELGRLFTLAKRECKHGEWGGFIQNLSTKVGINERTAQRYMLVFKEFNGLPVEHISINNLLLVAKSPNKQEIKEKLVNGDPVDFAELKESNQSYRDADRDDKTVDWVDAVSSVPSDCDGADPVPSVEPIQPNPKSEFEFFKDLETKLVSPVEILESKVKGLTAQLLESKALVSDLTIKSDSLQRDNDSLQYQNDSLKHENGSLKHENDLLKSELLVKEDTIFELTKEVQISKKVYFSPNHSYVFVHDQTCDWVSEYSEFYPDYPEQDKNDMRVVFDDVVDDDVATPVDAVAADPISDLQDWLYHYDKKNPKKDDPEWLLNLVFYIRGFMFSNDYSCLEKDSELAQFINNRYKDDDLFPLSLTAFNIWNVCYQHYHKSEDIADIIEKQIYMYSCDAQPELGRVRSDSETAKYFTAYTGVIYSSKKIWHIRKKFDQQFKSMGFV